MIVNTLIRPILKSRNSLRFATIRAPVANSAQFSDKTDRRRKIRAAKGLTGVMGVWYSRLQSYTSDYVSSESYTGKCDDEKDIFDKTE